MVEKKDSTNDSRVLVLLKVRRTTIASLVKATCPLPANSNKINHPRFFHRIPSVISYPIATTPIVATVPCCGVGVGRSSWRRIARLVLLVENRKESIQEMCERKRE